MVPRKWELLASSQSLIAHIITLTNFPDPAGYTLISRAERKDDIQNSPKPHMGCQLLQTEGAFVKIGIWKQKADRTHTGHWLSLDLEKPKYAT